MAPNDGDRTVIIPTPGRQNRPQQTQSPASGADATQISPAGAGAAGAARPAPASMGASAASSHATLQVSSSLNKLVGAATELLALVGELRHTVQHGNAGQLRNSLIDQLKTFETKAKDDGQASEVVLSARYILCSALDEAVLNTPWGPESGWAQHSLLSTFHNETSGGEKVFLILNRLLQTPAQYIDILELIYLCLSLGFSGKYQLDPNGHHQLEQIKENLYRAIEMQRGTYERELSPRWKGIEQANQKVRDMVPMWVVFSMACLILVAAYAGFRVWLDHTTTPVASQLEALASEYSEDVSSKTPE